MLNIIKKKKELNKSGKIATKTTNLSLIILFYFMATKGTFAETFLLNLYDLPEEYTNLAVHKNIETKQHHRLKFKVFSYGLNCRE